LRGDLDELVFQVSAFGGDQQRAAMPHKIPGERLVAPAAVTGAAPEPTWRERRLQRSDHLLAAAALREPSLAGG